MRTVRANSAGVALEEVPDPVPGPGQAPFLTGVVAMADIGVAFEQLRHPDKHVKLLVRP